MKINGKRYRLTERGRKVKMVVETAFAGLVGGAFGYILVLHWFG